MRDNLRFKRTFWNFYVIVLVISGRRCVECQQHISVLASPKHSRLFIPHDFGYNPKHHVRICRFLSILNQLGNNTLGVSVLLTSMHPSDVHADLSAFCKQYIIASIRSRLWTHNDGNNCNRSKCLHLTCRSSSLHRGTAFMDRINVCTSSIRTHLRHPWTHTTLTTDRTDRTNEKTNRTQSALYYCNTTATTILLLCAQHKYLISFPIRKHRATLVSTEASSHLRLCAYTHNAMGWRRWQ